MPRTARIVIPGVPHHITHRGHNRQDVFIDDADRKNYISILRKRCDEIGVIVHGYCLMKNHVHLVATPSNHDGLARAIGYAHRMYSKRLNKRLDRGGKLWHPRFFSCPLDENHFFQALIYVDRNPVRTGLVGLAWEYPWSSALAHTGKDDPAGLVDPTLWRKIAEGYDWKTVVSQVEDERVLSQLRKHTRSGRSLGNVRDDRVVPQETYALGNVRGDTCISGTK